MIKVSKRIQCLASFLTQDDCIIDVGCDHALLCIYALEKGICKRAYASDIRIEALKNAKQNIQKYGYEKQITTVLQDGLTKIRDEVNTAVIAGMGGQTILQILKKQERALPKYIFAAHSHTEALRKYMMQQNYKIVEEKVLYDKKHWYTLIHYQKGKESLKEIEIRFGKYDASHKKYYQFLWKKYHALLSLVPTTSEKKKELEQNMRYLQTYLEKESR